MTDALCVLVVEDSEDDALLVKLELQRQGIPLRAFRRVETQDDFEQALASESWDLVLADYHLPTFSGPAALACLRSKPELDIPFILMSGMIGEEAAVAALKQGAHDFVRKDNLARLGTAIHREVAEAAERRGRREAEVRLLHSEEKFRKLFHHASDAIIYLDAEGLILDANLAAAMKLGVALEDLVGQTLPHYVASLHRSETMSRLRGLADGYADTALFESVICNVQGMEIPIEFNVRRLDGNPLPSLLAIARDVTERKRTEAQVRYLADHDPLTRMPNRTLMEGRIELLYARARRYGKRIALLFFDLDRFKTVNDSLGHEVGDRLLQAAARRLTSCVRESDLVARWGGDEFVLVLPDIAQVEAAAAIATKILAEFRNSFRLGNHELILGASIGISIYPDDGTDTQTLIKHADMAMYSAKESGRNTFRFFESGMHRLICERMAIENDLRLAIVRGELCIHYQPQWNLSTRRIVGMEALMRWNHPRRGAISPAQFIPLAEESGQIVDLGRWILENACRQSVEWQKVGLPVLPVAVNLSALEFRQRDFVNAVRGVLVDTGLPAVYLELEVTESAWMREVPSAHKTLEGLKHLGITIAIDDFGTGFSSLSYLRHMPVDRLKIDKSFIKDAPVDAGSAAIVRAIIGMARSFRLAVIAEGVETEAQASFLQSENCPLIQGYYFSYPLPPDEMATLLFSLRHANVLPP